MYDVLIVSVIIISLVILFETLRNCFWIRLKYQKLNYFLSESYSSETRNEKDNYNDTKQIKYKKRIEYNEIEKPVFTYFTERFDRRTRWYVMNNFYFYMI